MLRVLVVEDLPRFRRPVVQWFTERLTGYEVLTAETRDEALAVMAAKPPDLVLLDLIIPGSRKDRTLSQFHGDQVLDAIRDLRLHARVIVLSMLGAEARDYLKLRGVDDYFAKDLPAAWEREELPQQVADLIGHLACRSPAMRHVRDRLDELRPDDRLLLITGPSGSGKRHLASVIHRCSHRRHGTLREASLLVHGPDGIATLVADHSVGGVVVTGFEHVGQLGLADSARLAATLATVRSGAASADVRVYLASCSSLPELQVACAKANDLARLLGNASRLDVPRLADRGDDVAELAEVFCREEAVRLGRGIRLSARAALVLRSTVVCGALAGEAAGLRSLIAQAARRAKAEIRPGDLDLGLPIEFRGLVCRDGQVESRALSAVDLAELEEDSAVEAVFYAESGLSHSRVSRVRLDGRDTRVDEERLGRILYLLASRPGEVVPLGEYRSQLGLHPRERIAKLIFRLRQLLGDTGFEGRTSKFIKSHWGESYSFTTGVPYAVIARTGPPVLSHDSPPPEGAATAAPAARITRPS